MRGAEGFRFWGGRGGRDIAVGAARPRLAAPAGAEEEAGTAGPLWGVEGVTFGGCSAASGVGGPAAAIKAATTILHTPMLAAFRRPRICVTTAARTADAIQAASKAVWGGANNEAAEPMESRIALIAVIATDAVHS